MANFEKTQSCFASWLAFIRQRRVLPWFSSHAQRFICKSVFYFCLCYCCDVGEIQSYLQLWKSCMFGLSLDCGKQTVKSTVYVTWDERKEANLCIDALETGSLKYSLQVLILYSAWIWGMSFQIITIPPPHCGGWFMFWQLTRYDHISELHSLPCWLFAALSVRFQFSRIIQRTRSRVEFCQSCLAVITLSFFFSTCNACESRILV